VRLFSSFSCRDAHARNRIVASPMCQYSSVDGCLTDWHLAHLGRLGIGGAGIVFVEETAVAARGRKTHACAGLWRDDQVPSFRRAAALLDSVGAVPAIQLGHAGRRASTHDAQRDWAPLRESDRAAGLPPWRAVGPSPVPVDRDWPVPTVLTRAGIDDLIQAWAAAATRAVAAGFRIVEIHGAHGYLLHQFLSPVTNRRTDAYGGSRPGRMRLAVEVTEAVRAALPAGIPLFFRVSCVDGRGGAWSLEDTVKLARVLRSRDVDVVDCSSGGISGDSPMPLLRRVPGYQVEFARAVRERAKVATMAVGLITEPRQAQDILDSGSSDLIGLARELLVRGDWPHAAAVELGEPAAYDLLPAAYAFRLHRRDMVARMPLNNPEAVGDPTEDELRVFDST
jgi:2,4-dienoyl-CoA reductase-like NADH-dependent reductase (Old Yellow Enzyme family)